MKICYCKQKSQKRLFKVIVCENCAKQVRLLRFLLMQKFEKNQQKLNFLQLRGHLKTLKFLINFCTVLKVLRRSNFLLLLCSKRKTKNIFTPPYYTSFRKTHSRNYISPKSTWPKLQHCQECTFP